MLNDPRDVIAAKSSCDSAENEVKADQYLSKAHQCGESHLCRRALNINAGVWPHRRSTGISHQALGAICQQCSVQHGDQASHTRLYNAGVGIVALKGRPDYCLWGSRRGRRSRPDCSRRLHYNDAQRGDGFKLTAHCHFCHRAAVNVQLRVMWTPDQIRQKSRLSTRAMY
jgi:hypothetical protein